jgi:very-short-patch-repair endonuclease
VRTGRWHFYAPGAKLVVELDGGQHFESRHAEGERRRDDYLRGQGLHVLRFDNLQVLKEGQEVLGQIWAHVEGVLGADAGKSPLPPFVKGG